MAKLPVPAAKDDSDSVGEESLPVIYHASKSRAAFGLAGSLAFVLAAAFLVVQHGAGSGVAWLSLVFFGLCTLVFGINLLPRSSYLLLEPEGFTVRSLYRDHFTPWSEVGLFHPGFMGATTMVLYDMPSGNQQEPAGSHPEGNAPLPLPPPGKPDALVPALRGMDKALCGYHGALPDTYGWSPEELAHIMNAWRSGSRALEEAAGGSAPDTTDNPPAEEETS